MFNLPFGFKKRSEATGFKPQSKRYQGPAMRLETMRTPSGLVLDDTESAEESEFEIEIEDFDSDWDVTEEDSEGAEEFYGDESDGDDIEFVGEGSTEPTFGDEELEELPFFDLEGEEAIADEPSGGTEVDAVTDITDNADTSDEGVEDVEFIETEGESDENTGDETAIDPEEDILSETVEEEVEAEKEFETAATDETEIGEEDLDPEANEIETSATDETEIGEEDLDPEANEIETSEEPENDELETVDSQSDETDAEDTEPENIGEEESESEVIAETENNSSNEEIEETDELAEETDTEESELVADADLSNLQPNFEYGKFTVGETGEVEVDFIVDGGAYKGEVALVSLSGMEGIDPNSKEFVLEAVSRAASNSELGYVVINDITEGARFTGRLGEPNFNFGQYQGVKTFMMRPGDEFFLMLVPNGTVQQVLDNPNAGGALRPLFSLATANPDDAYHVGQIADITGDGSAFAWEDIRVDGGSDRDYNDIILQFRGATGKAALMDDVVAEGKDWRGSELGQAVIEYVKTYVTPDPIHLDAAVEDLLADLESLFDEPESFDEDLNLGTDTEFEEETSLVDEIAETPVEEEAIVTEDNSDVADEIAETPVEEEGIVAEDNSDVAEEIAETPVEIVVEAAEDNSDVVDEIAETPVEIVEEAAETSVEEEAIVAENTSEVVEESAETPVEEEAIVVEDNSEIVEESAEDSVEIVEEATETPGEEEAIAAEDTSEVVEEAAETPVEEEGIVVEDNSEIVEESAENSVEIVEETAETPVEEEAIVAEDTSEVVEEAAETSVEIGEEAAETPVEEEAIVAEDTSEVVEEAAETSVEEEAIVAEDESSSPMEVEAEVIQNTASSSAADDIQEPNLNSPTETPEITPTEAISTPDSSPTDLAKTELISRLDNLTQTLKIQANNSQISSVSVNTALIERLETLTQNLQSQNSSRSISESTFALVSRLEEMVWQSSPALPVPAPSFSFATANQPLVGVIDTGFSGNNPDIDYSRITWGRDHIDGDNDPTLAPGEGNEHGTHTLGIIAAQRDNGIGIDGINPDAPIWAGRAVGSGKWAESLVEFVDAARESGQPNAVVNLSLDLTQIDADGNVTTRYEFTPQERAAIEYARQHNVMLVVAAGNDGGVMSVLGQSSQEFDNIITVGAAERFNDEIANSKAFDRANYSSYGRGLDIMAPVADSELSTVGEGVGTMAGTSVATAKVTGAVSQIWAANPQLSYPQVISILKSTATDLKESNWDRETGAGLLNMAAAVHLAKATKPEEYDPAPFLIPTTWSGEGKVTARERAVNSNSVYLSTDLGEIVQFDLGTGQKRHIYQGQAFTDLAIAPNGKLYGSTFNHLFEINTSTGEETYIGRFGGPNINSLTFSPDGRLYGADEKSGDVFEISPQTARLTYIGNLGGPSSGDMVFNGASEFFATVGSPWMERDRLVAFDLNTRHARTITELSDDQFYGLAMHNGQLIGYTARNQEIALDPLTGQIKSISVVPVSGAIWGAAQNYNNVSSNPSPSSDWQQAMEREYQDMKGLLGNPTGPYATASRSPQGTEGIWRAYQNGTIHWTPQHGAVAVWLDLQREYNEQGGSGGWLGFPTQREHDWNGGKRTLFEGGYIYWDGQRAKAYRHGELPTPNWQQAMEREYQDMKGLLGNPTGPYATAGRSPQGTEGIWRAYETGTIHWSSQYGAVAVWLDLQREYNEQGGSGGWLGFPIKREYDWNGGKRTDFEGGFIYWDGQRATAYRNGEFVITKEHLDKFARVAAKYPEIGTAKGPVTHNGGGVLQQNFQSGYIIWNGQQITVYDTSEVSQESGTDNTPISQNQPFQDYVFSSSQIDLRTSPTSSNNARSGILAPPGLELAFEGWTYGETLTDLKTGDPNAIWYKFIDTEGTGETFWVPSAWMGGFPPGNPPLVPPGSNSGSNSSNGSYGGSSKSVIEALMTAIIGQESGYNYQAINPHSGALGFAQIMPFNLPSWSREALGYEITREQFLNSPDLQLRIIGYKLNQYYQNAIAASGGNVDIAVRRVASAWYSGNPNLYTSTTPQYYNGNPYPSIAEYTLSVLEKFKEVYKPGGSQATGSSGGSSGSDGGSNSDTNPYITQALDNLLGEFQITDPWGYYPGQCVSFVKRFTDELGITMNPTGGDGGAKEGFINYNQPGLSLSASQADKIYFTGAETPRVGDIVFFNSTSINRWGHVAVIQSVLSNDNVIIQESNGDDKAWTTGTYVTRREVNLNSLPSGYGSTMGWLRLKI